MGTQGFEPRSSGHFLKATDRVLSHCPKTHHSMTGAAYTSQVVLRPLPNQRKKGNL